MHIALRLALACVATLAVANATAQTNDPNHPTWWNKYQQLSNRGSTGSAGLLGQPSVPPLPNADASNECGPQSETFITLNPILPTTLTAGSNEIFRLPMRGYFSSDGGMSWGGVDLPLPPPIVTNGTRFGSDPSLAYDTRGNVFYSYIVVFFSNGKGINGTEMATARSSDGGQTYPTATFFSFSDGKNHFNDKPMITVDTNLSTSPFRDNVYVAWDAASGGSVGGGIRVATSTDHGLSFSVHRVDNPNGPGKAIGAVPFVGPDGEVYVAWNDYAASTIAFNRSFDGGNTWGTPRVISNQSLGLQALPPAQSFRGALLYPTCSADRSAGPHRGRLYCAWMDAGRQGTTDIESSFSDDRGASWSAPMPVTDRLPSAVDRFYPWLSADPVSGDVNVAFYDTRNDTTGFRYMTDVYLGQSQDGGVSWPNTRVSSASSNEHDCAGVFPCTAIDYGNQYGDYIGLVSQDGISHPIWTDSRDNQVPAAGCQTNLLMEEVFSATVK